MPRFDMKIVVRAELITDWGDSSTIELGEIERPSQTLEPETVGLSLEDGKGLLRGLQQAVIQAQTDEICTLRRVCQRCHRWTELKDYRQRKVDTVFGIVSFRSPRIISCACEPPFFLAAPFCPLLSIIPERATPELLARPSPDLRLCRSALRPVTSDYERSRETLSTNVLPAGCCHDARVSSGRRQAQPPLAKATTEWTIAIDGGFVRGRGKTDTRNFEILTGRLAAPGVKPYIFAWIRSEVPSTTERVAALVRTQSGTAQPLLSVITDGANGIQSIHRELPFPANPILDWFHISMRVRYLEQIISGLWSRSETEQYTKKLLGEYVSKLRWCFWHANRKKAEQRMRQILMLCRIVVPEAPKFKASLQQLDFRLREFFAYLESNKGTTIDYGKRYRAGKPISTAMAESAVNQVLNARICKRRQMRWTPRGAHLLAQVRCAVINGDLLAKLKAYTTQQAEEIPEHVTRFLECLQRAAA